MNLGITNLSANMGMDFSTIILIAVMIGGLIFYAKDFKIGLIMQFLMSGLLFMWFYSAGWNYVPALIIFFITLIAMSLSLFAVAKSGSQGAII